MHSPLRGQILLMKKDRAGKERPILVASPKFLNGGNSIRGIPFSSQQLEKRREFDTCAFFSAGEFNLDLDCVAMASDISEYRLSEFQPGLVVGTVDDDRMLAVSKALCHGLGIDFHAVAAAYPPVRKASPH